MPESRSLPLRQFGPGTAMLYGARLLAHVDFPIPEVLGPGASEDDIRGLVDWHKMIFIKPQFKGG